MTKVAHMEETYSLKAAAKYLKVSRSSLRRWVDNGLIASTREYPSGYHLITRGELDEFARKRAEARRTTT